MLQQCYLRTSACLIIILSLLYISSILSLVLLPIIFSEKILLIVILIYSYINAITMQGIRTANQAVRLIWYNEQFWSLVDNKQGRFKAKLHKTSYCGNFFMVLSFTSFMQQSSCIKKKVIIFRDALSGAEYHYLAAGTKKFTCI